MSARYKSVKVDREKTGDERWRSRYHAIRVLRKEAWKHHEASNMHYHNDTQAEAHHRMAEGLFEASNVIAELTSREKIEHEA